METVTHISRHGFWLLLDDHELFVPFEEFPWFREAPVSGILNVDGRSLITCTGRIWTLTWQ